MPGQPGLPGTGGAPQTNATPVNPSGGNASQGAPMPPPKQVYQGDDGQYRSVGDGSVVQGPGAQQGQTLQSTYGNWSASAMPTSGPSPLGQVTDGRVPMGYSGRVYDPFSWGGNGGQYKDGQFQWGSDGDSQAANQYASLASAAAARQAYQTGTANTSDAMGLMQQAANGSAPSAAQMLARNQLDQGLQNQLAMASGARGGSLAQAAALRNAQMGMSGQLQQGVNQIGALRAEEMANARNAYGNFAGSMAQQQMQAELAQRQLNQQGQLAYYGMRDAANQQGVQARTNAAAMALGQYNTQAALAQQGAIADRAANSQLLAAGIGAGGGLLAAGATSILGKPVSAAPVGNTAPSGGNVGGNAGGTAPAWGDAGGGSSAPSADDPNAVPTWGDDPNSDARVKRDIQPVTDDQAEFLRAEAAKMQASPYYSPGEAPAAPEQPKSRISEEEAAKLMVEAQRMAANPYYAPKDVKKPASLSEAAAARSALQAQRMQAQMDAGYQAGPAVRPSDPMGRALDTLTPYSYRYQPGVPGEDPNKTHVGPMANPMARDPVASTAVTTNPQTGTLMIDSKGAHRLALGGLGYLKQQQDEQRMQLAELAAQIKAQRDAAKQGGSSTDAALARDPAEGIGYR